MSGIDCLALTLAWTRTRGSTMVLQMIFGITASSVSTYLRFGCRILIMVLSGQAEARLEVPCAEKIQEYKDSVKAKYELLDNVWCCMDGLKLKLEQAGDNTIQNMFYNGWTHDHYVTGVYVFCPDGTIPIATYNVPGSFHDSKIANLGKSYEKMEVQFEGREKGGSY